MKKILTSLFALAAVFCASAEVPTYSVSPADGSTIENRENLTVTFTFSEEVKVDSVQFMGGARFNPTLTAAALSMNVASKVVEVTVPTTAWGEVNGDEYLLTLTLFNISDKNGNPIKILEINEDDEAVLYDFKASATYSSPAPATEANFLGVTPAVGEMSVWQVYNDGWGAIEYHFSDEVNVDNLSGSFVFGLTDEEMILQVVAEEDMYADWDYWTGDYIVVLFMQPNDNLTESTLESITVHIEGLKTESGNNIEIANVVYTNPPVSNPDPNSVPKAPTKNYQSASLDLNVVNTTVDVYSISGSLVSKGMNKAEISNLASGIYVVNGKKVIVK